METKLSEVVASFKKAVSDDTFVRFVNKLHQSDRRRLAFWQQKLWDEFCEESQQWNELTFDEILGHFQICELHLTSFVKGRVPVIEGFHMFTDEDVELRSKRFLYGREYQVRAIEWRPRTEQASAEEEVAFCPKCREEWLELTNERPSLREHLDWFEPGRETPNESKQRDNGVAWPFEMPDINYDESWLGWADWFSEIKERGYQVEQFARANFTINELSPSSRRIEFVYRGRGYVWEPRLFDGREFISLGPLFGAGTNIRISLVSLEVARYVAERWLNGLSPLDITYDLYLSSSGILSLTEDEYPACMAKCATCQQVLLDGHLNSARVKHLESKYQWTISGLEPADDQLSDAVYLGQHASICPRCGASTLDMRWDSVAGPALKDLM